MKFKCKCEKNDCKHIWTTRNRNDLPVCCPRCQAKNYKYMRVE